MNPDKGIYPWQIENFSFTYAYSEVTRSNINTASYDYRNYKGGIAYSYQPRELNIQPFKNVGFLASPWLRLIKDINFNLLPTSIIINGDINRSFTKTQLRNADLGIENIDPYFEKSFTFDRSYALNWNLAQRLTFDYNANVNAVIDEPEGNINTDIKRDSVWNNFKSFGRIKNYRHRIDLTYTIPLDKLPATDWINSDITYSADYSWVAGAVGQSDTLGNVANNGRTINFTGKFNLVKLYNNIEVLKKINSPSRGRSRSRPNPNDTLKKKKSIDEIPVVKGLLRTLMFIRSVDFNYSKQEGTVLQATCLISFCLEWTKDFRIQDSALLLVARIQTYGKN